MDAATQTPAVPTCHCGGRAIRWGKDAQGFQRLRCKTCKATFAPRPARPLGTLLLASEKAILCLSLLVEGSSIRSTERVTGVHRDTIGRLLRVVGSKAEAALSQLRGLTVKDVQADEIWGYVGMKEKTKARNQISDPQIGDAYTFVGFDRDTKMVLSWHLGSRSAHDTSRFMAKLAHATQGNFQLTTDGFNAYPAAVEEHLGGRVDFAQLIKTYSAETVDSERRYSPARILAAEKVAVCGAPQEDRICTSHVERQNLTMRIQIRRLTRLTNAFSKRWECLRAALALYFWNYNFCHMHRTLRMTPAMKAGVARRPLRVEDLIAA